MTLKPFVYWAQTESEITMRVDVKDATQPEVCIEEEEIEVTVAGLGAQGGLDKRNYHFVVEFFLPIDKEQSSYQVLDRGIQIVLKKRDPDWWPRLLYQQQKLAWLKVCLFNEVEPHNKTLWLYFCRSILTVGKIRKVLMTAKKRERPIRSAT